MHEQVTRQKFVELRTPGRSFARIAMELKVSSRMLIELEALQEQYRAVRAHRQLIKLAPKQCDPVVVERLACEREERKLHDAEIAVVLAKVYGESVGKEKLHQPQNGNRSRNGAEMVQFSRRKEDAVEWRLAEGELWPNLGHEAFDRHQRLRLLTSAATPGF